MRVALRLSTDALLRLRRRLLLNEAHRLLHRKGPFPDRERTNPHSSAKGRVRDSRRQPFSKRFVSWSSSLVLFANGSTRLRVKAPLPTQGIASAQRKRPLHCLARRWRGFASPPCHDGPTRRRPPQIPVSRSRLECRAP